MNKVITVTSPLLPPLEEFIPYLEDIWRRKWLTNNGFYHQELEKALYELPEEQRYVFEQTELNGLTFIELSEMCKTPVNTLISRKHYAVRYLRKRLKNIYESLIYEE